MYPVKQSTALTIPVFAHDANGDAVTGLVDGDFTKRISKNGAAFAAMTVTLSEMENGWYSLPLSSTHTDTLGVLTVTLTHASAKQINVQLRVHARLPDDLAFPNTSGRGLDVDAAGGVEVGSFQSGAIGAAAFAAGAIDAAAIAADAIGAAALAADAVAEIADAVWDEASADHVAAGSTGERVERLDIIASGGAGGLTDARAANLDNLDAAVSSRATPAQVNTEVDNALNTAIPASPVADSINERIATLDDNYTAARAAKLDNLDAAVTTRATPAQVNTEVLDVMNVDTFAEPGQETPPATASLVKKIGYLYKLMRNRITVTSGQVSVYNDDAVTIDQKATHSDDGTTYDRGEFASGP